MEREILAAVLVLSATNVIAHEAPSLPSAKADYISAHIELFDVQAERIDTFRDKDVPAFRYALKNNGSETLTKIQVTVYFLDREGLAFFEEDYYPIWVSDSATRNEKPLRPNYSYRMESDTWMTEKRLGDEWSGKIRIEIVDVEFAE